MGREPRRSSSPRTSGFSRSNGGTRTKLATGWRNPSPRRARGEKADAVTPLHMLAAAARVDGDIGQARQFYRENLGLNRELGRLDVVSVELGNLGALEVLEGNISEAVPFLRESLEIAYKRGDRYLAPYERVWLGRVALAQGRRGRGATLFAAAQTQFDATGLAMDADERPED